MSVLPRVVERSQRHGFEIVRESALMIAADLGREDANGGLHG
jgi:hypothetical protein